MKFRYLLPVLGTLFILGYVPTATVFTTSFFLSHAPVEANFRMFGMALVSFLPVTVFCLLASMEMFSFRLANLFWQASTTKAASVTIALFIVLQALPVSSMYIGTRYTAFKDVAAAAQEDFMRRQQANQREERQREVALAAGSDDLGRLERLRDDVAQEISTNENQRQRLLRIRPARRSEEVMDEILRLTTELDVQRRRRAELDGLITARSANRATLDRPAEGADEVATVPIFGDFLATEFWSFDAFVSLLLSGVFPVAALAFGYVSAHSTSNTPPIVAFDVSRELEVGAARPEADHPAFSELLKASITAYVVALRASGDLASEAAIFHLRDDRGLQLIQGFTDLKKQVLDSRLSSAAKDNLLTHVERLQTEHFRQQQQKEVAA